jgi:pimeloyl-ACP methyl ester carboxylesterase
VPVTLVGGTWDVLAGARDMATAAERIPDATYVELAGSHFLQMEQPDRVHELLLELIARVG